MKLLLSVVLFCSTLISFSEKSWGQEVVPTVVIGGEGSQSSPLDQFSVFKAEKVDKEKLRSPTRPNLADVVQDQVGVDTQTFCANCGAKRLTINGLKGEHTSILVDGLPLHSAVSSFYGVDNVPVNGIENILVMRGAGASLTNPEAIGGTLDIQTVDPLNSSSNYLTSIGVDDSATGKSQNYQILYTHPGASKRWGITMGGQFSRTETWDEDNNSVSESPQRENFSGMAKTRFFLGKKNDFTARVGYSQLEVLGGFSDPTKPSDVRAVAAREADFVNGSVEDKFIGDPEQITDWIKLQRN
ncbi:MAG: TonB-dependent receptor plug domain-containing protein, partial [Pseudomonadota bacterium]